MTADVDLSKDFIINNKYKLIRKIGSGSFGTIYLAVHLQKGEEIAVKMESANARHPQLHHESNVYRVLGRANGIPAARFFGVENGYNCLVMELLGPSLEDLFNRCSRRFSLKTSLMLMEQMIRRIELIHTKNYAYRDVKPDNFMMGIGASSNKLFLVDFGLAKAYRDARTHAHIPFTNKKSLTGTARYASINSHQGFELSRRDDMESLAYIMVYFLKGRLPWQGIQENDKRKKYAKICEKKMETSVEELCGGLPVEFGMYLHYCRRLKFYDEPDYEYCSNLFRGLFHNAGYLNDYRFDWSVAEKRSASVQSVDPSINQHPTHKANRY